MSLKFGKKILSILSGSYIKRSVDNFTLAKKYFYESCILYITLGL